MREKNPEMVAGEKRRFVMKPPQISKAGAKKTAFANFAEICKMYGDLHVDVLMWIRVVFFGEGFPLDPPCGFNILDVCRIN